MSMLLLIVSFYAFFLGTVLSVAERWARVGLTDTSYTTIVLWLVGSLGILVAGILLGSLGLSCLGVLASAAGGYTLNLKVYDHRQYYKGVRSHLLREGPVPIQRKGL